MRIILAFLLVALAAGEFYYEKHSPIVDQINEMQTSWTATLYPKFEHWTEHQLKRINGAREVPEWMRLPEKTDFNELAVIPDTFDARLQWPNCQTVKEIRDQSMCGSCWAFGTAEAFSDRICIASNQTVQTHISSEDINSCCGQTCGDGCDGGYAIAAWQWLKGTGACTGDLYGDTNWCMAYTVKPCPSADCPDSPTPPCKKQCVPQYTSFPYAKDKHMAKSAYSLPNNIQKLQQEIMTYGPITVTFAVYDDFYNYKSGVYVHKTGEDDGNHTVKMLGWGHDATSGLDYWIIANSWGTSWGENGYFRIVRGKNECNIEAQAVAGIPL